MIYFDNAATSFPKAPGVSDCVKKFIDEKCFNVGRGAYAAAFETEQIVFETRELLADFFHAQKGKSVIFTCGLTQSLNAALFGLLKGGDKAITSSMEHNAVLRPLWQLKKQGVGVDFAPCNADGEVCLSALEGMLKNSPKVLVMTHASNICGAVMPLFEIGELCKKYGVLFALDAAQTGGVIDIDMERDNIDVLCFSGHKGLLSLQGVGGYILSERAASMLEPFVFGGTGSLSHSLEMPRHLPDRFEAGTPNLVGIAALNCSLKYIIKQGIENIYQKEIQLQQNFENGIKEIKNITIVGGGAKKRCAVTALDFLSLDNSHAAFRLDSEMGIMVRSGLHCAPLAHKTLGTFPKGAVRFSFGHANTREEIDISLSALKRIAAG